MICKECGNKQNVGRFCGLCGGTLVATEETLDPIETNMGSENFHEHTTEKVEGPEEFQTQMQGDSGKVTDAGDMAAASHIESPVNENIEIAKEKFSTFLDFFKSYIKKPLNVLGNAEAEFTNRIISILTNLFILSLTASIVGKNVMGNFVSYLILGNLFKIFILLTINTLLIGSLSFLIGRISRGKKNYKEFIAIYGAYTLPIIIISLLALLLSIISSNGMAVSLLFLSIFLGMAIIPQYLVIVLLSQNRTSIDPFYGQLIYLLGAFIIYIIIIAITADSALGEILNQIGYYF